MNLPPAVSGYLQQVLAGVFQPAYVLVDGDGTVTAAGGDLGRYGYSDLQPGDTVNEKLWFLAGVVPVEGDEPLVLPSVSIRDGGPTHIHLIPSTDGTWVLLVDAWGDDSQQQLLKQAFNRLDLLRQQESPPAVRRRTNPEPLDSCAYATALGALGGVLLERVAESRFSICGEVPAWLSSMFPVQDGTVDMQESPFLIDFLDQAEGLWQGRTTQRIDSGLWTESTCDGGEEHLEALAISSDDRPLLFLCRRTDEHDKQQRILQTAREQNLRFERMLKQMESNEILVHCIVHDLNGPLSGMMSCFDLLDLQGMGEKGRDLVQLGRRQAMAQRAMIHGILDAFAAEVESLHHVERDPKLAPDLLECSRNVVQNLAPVATTHGVRLELVPPLETRQSWKVIGEGTRLDRVLTNLIDNAIRHSPPSSTVRIRLEGDVDNIICHVEDEGPGVPATVAHTLFDKLTKTADGGGKAGLGLYFCRITVERWGGAIGFSPRTGGGTDFWFRLEAADLPESSLLNLTDILAERPVLVVEDDDISRRIVKELLTASNIKTLEAASGEAALMQAGAHDVAAVLMDVHLPGMSGIDTAIRLRDKDTVKGPIIAVTADVSVTDSDLGRLFDEVIQKPFSLDQLRSVLIRGNRRWTRLLEEARKDRSDGCALPFTIPGIDVDGTLHRLGGDADLFVRLLSRFENRCREACSELKEMILAEQRESALRLVHGLKGTAANLGAVGVVSAMKELEDRFHSDDDHSLQGAEAFSASIDELAEAAARLRKAVDQEEA